MTKRYNVTVNGTLYEVEVEELGETAASTPAVSAAAPAPAAPVKKEAPKAAPKAAAAGAGTPVTVPVEINNHNATAEFKVFADALVNDTPIDTTVYEGAKTVAACLAIIESSKTGKIVNPDYNF